jgi:hypothetical protein
MERIAQAFRDDFAHWGLEIPPVSLASRTPGFIQAAGWLIQFVFGSDCLGEYLDYYASHRMTDDRHVRLYETGRQQNLASLQSFFVTSSDPLEAKRREAAYLRRNRRVVRQLAAKGFGKFTLNMALHAGLAGNDTAQEVDNTNIPIPRNPAK